MKAILTAFALITASALPVVAQTPAPNSQLCLSQLELLDEGNKLTQEEKDVFVAQCKCLEEQEQSGADEQGGCAQQ